jgi:hypothetical protein
VTKSSGRRMNQIPTSKNHSSSRSLQLSGLVLQSEFLETKAFH